MKTNQANKTFSAEEKAAMRERALELKAASNKADAEKLVLKKISEMPGPDRTIAKKIHAIVSKIAPTLLAKTWYGMPAYADKDGKVVIFFKAASKFKSRYATLGFEEASSLDEGNMWPTSYAITKLTPAEEKKITAMVKKATR